MAQLDTGVISMQLSRAEEGLPEEQFRAGLLYSTGDEVPLDLVTAHKWFNLAAMNGVVEARECRAEISQDMSPEEIAAAQKQAREWYLSH
ncbi:MULTISPECIES: sel1 repeat family protein [Sneathiella]|jgi:TPR repeat protein|uniref:sel1 repeat family protein n=1 Tax=Sneathiella TaxID=510690 RepID=UPI001469D6F1|nr:sel1 repeat family protein [Sneathiella aquimaris]